MAADFCRFPAALLCGHFYLANISMQIESVITSLLTNRNSVYNEKCPLGNISVVICVDRNTIFKVRGNKYLENILNVNCIHPVDLP